MNQLSVAIKQPLLKGDNLLTVKEASIWASDYLKRDISTTNISYLINYGKIKQFDCGLIDIEELKTYYASYHGQREENWKKRLGDDLNWSLSFDHLREKDTTKHVHRLHPYKGKFIPQLVEYFIDSHVDDFKKDIFFQKGDVILDPFSGSGTTLVQANELGMHVVGIDISKFNCSITEAKLANCRFETLNNEIEKIVTYLNKISVSHSIIEFEEELLYELSVFNKENFPSPQFKRDIIEKKINEDEYGLAKHIQFLDIYHKLIDKYAIVLNPSSNKRFLDKWYISNIYDEIVQIYGLIENITDNNVQNIIRIILSRTIRSCRATTHSDLATLKEPQFTTYYCYKHKKICKPLFSIKYWFTRYAKDTIARLSEFSNIKTNAYFSVLYANSRNVDIIEETANKNQDFGKLLANKKINGIFSSPPYVGQINYHEQHAYAYDLFGFERNDDYEIGPLFKGQGKQAKEDYINGIAEVLNNAKKYMIDDYNIFLVANDKWNLYPIISEKAKMKIVNRYKRPVLNRTERDRNPYSEIIFHLKKDIK